jgi:hypothetical protein
MRWCHHCRHFNTGWPMRCRYCAAGLDGRLCTRNHVNPLDWRLTFCGDCGAPLQRVSGAGFSARPYGVAAVIGFITLGLISLFLGLGPYAPGTALVLILVVALVGGGLAWQILPPRGQRVLTVIGRGMHVVLSGLGRWSFRLLFRRRAKTRKKRRE